MSTLGRIQTTFDAWQDPTTATTKHHFYGFLVDLENEINLWTYEDVSAMTGIGVDVLAMRVRDARTFAEDARRREAGQ